ncbi:MAG: DUF503 domain-containing protein [Candidatus Eremiobacteraeota bacterium]|nr:DUF503 domain-containing protein [Candidatus Eremiobacteraeota bacterium]
MELHLLEEPDSLKKKRAVVKSLKDRVRNRFGASIAEVDDLEKWQRATLGIAFVTGEKKNAESVLSKIAGYVESDGSVEIIGCITEYCTL